MQKERLTDEFSKALNNFQATQRLVAEKERESVKRARAQSGLDKVCLFLCSNIFLTVAKERES